MLKTDKDFFRCGCGAVQTTSSLFRLLLPGWAATLTASLIYANHSFSEVAYFCTLFGWNGIQLSKTAVKWPATGKKDMWFRSG
jgi:hypothetical protein